MNARAKASSKAPRKRTKRATTSSSSTAQVEERQITPTSIKGQARPKTSQEKGWRTVLNRAKTLVKNRPDDHLSSLLANLRELRIDRREPSRFYQTREIVRPLGEKIMQRAGLELSDTFYSPQVAANEYTVSAGSPIRYLGDLIRPDTTAIMELGSGWSSNVFQLYLLHGATRSRKKVYYGGEYTKSGMIAARYLASREPALKYRSFYFDYRNPNISFLSKTKGHILLFTSHSIEQVDQINPELFEQLRQMKNPTTVVHFEPVGWQRNEELLRRREAQDDAFFEAIGRRAADGALNTVDENAAWWSWRQEYNKNLIPILSDLERRNIITMKKTAFNFGGTANVLNPSTLLHYEFVR
ncbi:MAG: hypothetical protein RIG84_16195 [Roseovarius sp.]|uniref:hypothetical protein n=1 Tax=Marinovum TaxID=367771 RepID=UPI00065B1892|nr:hypothetical protein [Marinovum sp. PR37]AKO96982.1 hypothetical protein MALG_01810 [Marinovum algicola DG 898]MDD9745554.1 hypothetical protein [Marinovum sp. PR37]